MRQRNLEAMERQRLEIGVIEFYEEKVLLSCGLLVYVVCGFTGSDCQWCIGFSVTA